LSINSDQELLWALQKQRPVLYEFAVMKISEGNGNLARPRSLLLTVDYLVEQDGEDIVGAHRCVYSRLFFFIGLSSNLIPAYLLSQAYKVTSTKT
jgi:hypothetical protein